MKNLSLRALIISLIALIGLATAQSQIELPFFNHLQAGMHEQDVFVERNGELYRVTAVDEDMDAMLYSSASLVKHNPLDPEDTGPYPKGQPLGITQGDWLAATGSSSISCENGEGTFSASFENLIPGGIYTMWFSYMPTPAPQPFTSLDLPMGARDGSESILEADENGLARYSVTLSQCLPLSTENFAVVLALAYHSDGKTYGSHVGDFGSSAHIQLFSFMPSQTELAAQN